MPAKNLKLKCPGCGNGLKIQRRSATKSILCPKCQTKFKIDELSNTVVVLHEDLFGPPVSDDFSLGKDPFDNIDQIVDQKPAAASQLKTERNKTAPDESEQQALEEWQKHKKTTTKFEDSLNRNGTGLLILAAGIALLPFFGNSVEELKPVLFAVPAIAAGLAFVACFMLAYSLRRSNIGMVILSGLPFLLIGGLALGAHYYQKHFGNETQTAESDDDLEQQQIVELDPDNDRFSVDRESVTENVAAKFVPPDIDEEPENPAETEPENTSNTNRPKRSNNRSNIKPSGLRPTNVFRGRTNDAGDNQIKTELANVANASENSRKLTILKKRLNEFDRGLVSRDEIKTPELAANFQLSRVVGTETVYGVAYFGNERVLGFDVGYQENQVNSQIDLLVPILERAEFRDSVFASTASILIGLNANVTEHGIEGLQGIFKNAAGVESTGDWVGAAPINKQYESVHADGTSIFGVVVYRNQWSLAGLRLILGKKSAK